MFGHIFAADPKHTSVPGARTHLLGVLAAMERVAFLFDTFGIQDLGFTCKPNQTIIRERIPQKVRKPRSQGIIINYGR